jgi:hypothetical protein
MNSDSGIAGTIGAVGLAQALRGLAKAQEASSARGMPLGRGD